MDILALPLSTLQAEALVSIELQSSTYVNIKLAFPAYFFSLGVILKKVVAEIHRFFCLNREFVAFYDKKRWQYAKDHQWKGMVYKFL